MRSAAKLIHNIGPRLALNDFDFSMLHVILQSDRNVDLGLCKIKKLDNIKSNILDICAFNVEQILILFYFLILFVFINVLSLKGSLATCYKLFLFYETQASVEDAGNPHNRSLLE